MGDLANARPVGRARTVLHVALLVLLPALVFSNTLDNELQLDSIYRAGNNPELEQVQPIWRHFTDPRTSSSIPQLVQFRPLLPLTLSLDVAVADQLGVPRLHVWHVTNILLHVGAALALYWLLREMLALRPDAGARWPAPDLACGAALLFAVHPVSGVPVNYIAGRDESLMLLFLLAALAVHARMRRRGGSVAGWAATLLLFALSLCAKQNGLVAPALVLAFEALVAGASLRARATWLRVGAWVAVVAAFFAWTELVLDFSDLDQLHTDATSRWIYACTMLRTHVFYYLRNFVWPFSMRALPDIPPAAGLLEPGVLVGLAVVGGSLVLAWLLRRRAPLAAFAILAYWILFATTSSVLPFRYLAGDYRQYASLGFLCLLVVLLLARVPRRAAGVAAAGALLAWFGGTSFVVSRDWRTSETFWKQSVRLGGAPLAHMNYAKAVQARDPRLAEEHYREALRRSPEMVYARVNLGLLEIHGGRREEGLAELKRAVDGAPGWALAHYWYAVGLRKVGDGADALAEGLKAAELDPRNLDYQYLAAFELQAAGRAAESLPYLERVAALQPDRDLTRFMLGYALQRLDRWPEAEAAYHEFLFRQPAHAGAWFNLGYGLVKAGRADDARLAFEETLRLQPTHFGAKYWLDQLQGDAPVPPASAVPEGPAIPDAPQGSP